MYTRTHERLTLYAHAVHVHAAYFTCIFYAIPSVQDRNGTRFPPCIGENLGGGGGEEEVVAAVLEKLGELTTAKHIF